MEPVTVVPRNVGIFLEWKKSANQRGHVDNAMFLWTEVKTEQRSTMEMKMTHIPKGKREIAELDTHQWRTRSTMDLSMRNA